MCRAHCGNADRPEYDGASSRRSRHGHRGHGRDDGQHRGDRRRLAQRRGALPHLRGCDAYSGGSGRARQAARACRYIADRRGHGGPAAERDPSDPAGRGPQVREVRRPHPGDRASHPPGDRDDPALQADAVAAGRRLGRVLRETQRSDARRDVGSREELDPTYEICATRFPKMIPASVRRLTLLCSNAYYGGSVAELIGDRQRPVRCRPVGRFLPRLAPLAARVGGVSFRSPSAAENGFVVVGAPTMPELGSDRTDQTHRAGSKAGARKVLVASFRFAGSVLSRGCWARPALFSSASDSRR